MVPAIATPQPALFILMRYACEICGEKFTVACVPQLLASHSCNALEPLTIVIIELAVGEPQVDMVY